MRHMSLSAVVAALCVGSVSAFAPQAPPVFAVRDVRAGMVGTGRTVFAGDTIEDFQVHILGVVANVLGPGRDLVLARLEGGPLAQTGVIQGMSGSPVYIDGKLLGAVSYALGSFPKEPIAGITPIGDMVSATTSNAPRGTTGDFSLEWPATPAGVMAAIARVAERAAAPLGQLAPTARVQGAASVADLAPMLRPIGAAMVMSGFDPAVGRDVRGALDAGPFDQAPTSAAAPRASTTLRPGDPVGMALIRGDLEMGATGTVTSVDNGRVYAFGHPFLNLGPTTLAMTQARVYTVVPSLDSSLKIAALGPVVGTMTQDRATAVGGVLGPGPAELTVNLTLVSDHAPERRLQMKVLHDQSLTPLFAYVGLLNAITAYERQSGAMTIQTSGTASFGADGTVTIDDAYSGDGAAAAAAAGASAAIGMAASNEFKPALAQSLDVTVRTSERIEATTIERAWLDTTRPTIGATCTLQVLLRDYRGATETIAIPVTMPSQPGPVTLLVSDGQTLQTVEDRDLRPGRAGSWAELLNRMNALRHNNRVYVRLITSGPGIVVAGTPLTGLPSSVRTVFDEDKTVSATPVAKTVTGSWEQRLSRVVRGSRELTLTVVAR
ncbi:MAG TPA: SpoIVB peptidase S55 domain-containing protein [Vicinamibacterales bacterium]|nr:SpoIVB peptidase S55 domain-containing protein [Vicinamibacterales bacterium]